MLSGRIPSAMGMFGAMRIIEDPNALEKTEERKFPASRHRSARIHKKLVKRFHGEFVMKPCAFRTATSIILHPTLAAELRKELARRQDVATRAAFGL